jgi:hypothetical protein
MCGAFIACIGEVHKTHTHTHTHTCTHSGEWTCRTSTHIASQFRVLQCIFVIRSSDFRMSFPEWLRNVMLGEKWPPTTLKGRSLENGKKYCECSPFLIGQLRPLTWTAHSIQYKCDRKVALSTCVKLYVCMYVCVCVCVCVHVYIVIEQKLHNFLVIIPQTFFRENGTSHKICVSTWEIQNI